MFAECACVYACGRCGGCWQLQSIRDVHAICVEHLPISNKYHSAVSTRCQAAVIEHAQPVIGVQLEAHPQSSLWHHRRVSCGRAPRAIPCTPAELCRCEHSPRRRFLIVFPLVLVVCVASAYYDAKKELEKEPPPFKELPGGRIMLQDGSIVKAPR